MAEFPIITPDKHFTQEELVEMYNEAVEYIHELQAELKALDDELDLYQQAYDELTMKLYG